MKARVILAYLECGSDIEWIHAHLPGARLSK